MIPYLSRTLHLCGADLHGPIDHPFQEGPPLEALRIPLSHLRIRLNGRDLHAGNEKLIASKAHCTRELLLFPAGPPGRREPSRASGHECGEIAHLHAPVQTLRKSTGCFRLKTGALEGKSVNAEHPGLPARIEGAGESPISEAAFQEFALDPCLQ